MSGDFFHGFQNIILINPLADGIAQPLRACLRGKGDRIGAVRDQHGLGFRALVGVHAEKAGAGRREAGLDAVGDELAEDRIGGQRAVLLDFLGQLI